MIFMKWDNKFTLYAILFVALFAAGSFMIDSAKTTGFVTNTNNFFTYDIYVKEANLGTFEYNGNKYDWETKLINSDDEGNKLVISVEENGRPVQLVLREGKEQTVFGLYFVISEIKIDSLNEFGKNEARFTVYQ